MKLSGKNWRIIYPPSPHPSPGGRYLYFAYGSNINRAQMAQRCPDARPIATFFLPGWELRFQRYASIEPMVGGIVPGVVWSISWLDLRALDSYENAPFTYHKIWLNGRVNEDGIAVYDQDAFGGFDLFTYVHVPGIRPDERPSPEYLQRIQAGYADFKLTSHLHIVNRAAQAAPAPKRSRHGRHQAQV